MKSRIAWTCLIGGMLVAVPTTAGEGQITPTPPENLMDFNFHFRFLPTEAEIQRVKERVTAASEMICDATDGQVRFGTVKLTSSPADEELGDIWFLPEPGRSSVSTRYDGSNLGTRGRHINLKQEGLRSDIIAHEMGHQAFGLADEYSEQRRFGGSCGVGPGFDPGFALTETEHSLMQQTGRPRCAVPDPDSPGLFLSAGTSCQIDSECDQEAGESCEPILMSEFTVTADHDLLRGNHSSCADLGGAFNPCCNMGGPTDIVTLTGAFNGTLPTTSQAVDPAPEFDPTSLATAAATSAFFVGSVEGVSGGRSTSLEILDGAVGKVSRAFEVPESHHIWIFFVHVDVDLWDMHFVMDGREFDPPDSGDSPTFHLLQTLQLTFELGTEPVLADDTVSVTDLLTGGDFDITINVDALTQGTSTTLAASGNGIPMCRDDSESPTSCLRTWNSETRRYEGTNQTGVHNEAAWETIEDNYPFIEAPSGLPDPVMPESCTKEVNPVIFDDTGVFGSDQIAMIIDRSGSMNAAVDSDESQTRLEYAQAAARALVDLRTNNAAVEVGLISFDDIVTNERNIETIGTDNADDFVDAIDALTPRGRTAIGDALLEGISALEDIRESGRSQTILLLSDGQQNEGSDPREASEQAIEDGIRIYTVPVGDAADRELLADLAGESGGVMLEAPSGDELPPIYHELDARTRGNALILERTESTVFGESEPTITTTGVSPPSQQDFTFEVEAGGQVLHVMASGRHAGWNPGVQLISPGGVVRQRGSAGVTSDPFFVLFSVPFPQAGPWTLRLTAGSGTHRSFAIASLDHPSSDCFVDASPRVSGSESTVTVTGQASFGTDLVSGVTYTGHVRRPDGSQVPLQFSFNEDSQETTALFGSFAGRGVYQVSLTCNVAAGARVAPGEPIFEEPENTETSIAFQRTVSTTFFHDVSTQPPLPPGNDCDGDGILNADEAPGDTDGDGLPDICDGDGDDDDVPDADDPDPQDPDVPTCSRQPTSIACCTQLRSCEGTKQLALFANDSLRMNDRSKTQTTTGAFAAVVNGGATTTHLGVDSKVGNVHSRASVFAAERARVEGVLKTSGTLTRQNGVVITGGFAENVSMTVPDLAAFTVTFPPTNQGDRNLEPGQVMTIPPGSYRNFTIKSNARANLRSGVYFFETLQLEPQGQVRFTITSGPAFIYTRSGCTYRGSFINQNGRHDQVLWACFGTSDVPVESPFSGTLVAPRARISIGSGGPQTHRGAFFAKNIELQPDKTVQLHPFVAPWSTGGTQLRSLTLPPSDSAPSDAGNGSSSTSGCTVGATHGARSETNALLLSALLLVASRWRRSRRVVSTERTA